MNNDTEVICRECKKRVGFISSAGFATDNSKFEIACCTDCHERINRKQREINQSLRDSGEAFTAAQKALVTAINAATATNRMSERENCARLADDAARVFEKVNQIDEARVLHDLARQIRKRGEGFPWKSPDAALAGSLYQQQGMGAESQCAGQTSTNERQSQTYAHFCLACCRGFHEPVCPSCGTPSTAWDQTKRGL